MLHDCGMPYITSHDDTQLFYKDWGTGSRTVLFVNGSNIHSDFWESHMVLLADRGLRTIAYDQRGHGRSDQPGHGFEFDWLADDLASLVDQLNLRDVTLVGYSNGARRGRALSLAPRRRPRRENGADRADDAMRCAPPR